MSIKFNIVERGKPGDSQAPKKYYPSIQSTGQKAKLTIQLNATVTCPQCGFAKQEQMPPAT